MKYRRINEVYYKFITSKEYEIKLSKINFDISWIENKISKQDVYKLEQHVFNLITLNDKILFECGFQYAWDLFHELSANEKSIDPAVTSKDLL